MGAWPEREAPAEGSACRLRGRKGKGFKPFPFLFWINEKSGAFLQVAIGWGWQKTHRILLPCHEKRNHSDANANTFPLTLTARLGWWVLNMVEDTS